MERRNFVQACTLILACSFFAVGCGGGGGGSEPAEVTGNSSLPDLSKNRWTDVSSTNFSVSHSIYGAIDMELTAIDDDLQIPETEQFSITLRGPELPLLEEDLYQVYNDTFGYIELYLQPGPSTPGEQTYFAMFSILQS